MLAPVFALRYIFSKKSTNVINIITWISMLGMMVGAFSLIVVLSVFNGFEGLVLSLYNSFYPDMEVTAKVGKNFEESPAQIQSILKLDGVYTLSRVLEENAYLEYADQASLGTIKGVDENYTQVTQVNHCIDTGGSFIVKDSFRQYAVVGAYIAKPLNIIINPFMGEPLRITVPRRGVKSAFVPEEEFNTMSVIPRGVFSIQQEFDSKYVFVSLDFARQLLDLDNRVSAYEIKLKDGADIEKTRQQIAQIVGADFTIKNRYEQKAETYRIMKIERWVTTAILAFIILIISFNIIGSLTMLVLEKAKDISIIKAMGGNATLIRRIYLLNGMLASAIGAGVGLVLGYAVCLLQMKYHFLKLNSGGGSSFVIDYYPVALNWTDPLVIVAIIISLSLLASYFPARKAGQSAMSFK